MMLTLIAITFLGVLLWLWRVEVGLNAVPPEAEKLSPKRWTKEEILIAFHRITQKPIDIRPHLPAAKSQRRYIVVGGSGLVGGAIVLQLLARGQPPESIRIVDFRKTVRKDLLRGDATRVQFIQADITDEKSVRAAFNAPWDARIPDSWNLTVFHTAAIIIPGDRFAALQHRISRVNVVGTALVVSAAKAAGADVLISTSSGSVSIRPCGFWKPPWRKYPKNFVQPYPDPSKDLLIRPRNDYCGNYAVAKAQAEDLVRRLNGPKFRTGCIRPACGIYGNRGDMTVGAYLKIGPESNGLLPTWIPHIIQSFVHMDNVAIAHLHFEEALISSPEVVGGRAFTVTDPNPAVSFDDIYNLLRTLTNFQTIILPSVPMHIVAQIIEIYTLTRELVPLMKYVLPAIPPPLDMLQPAMLQVANSHQVASNEEISKFLGYKGLYTTIEGMCTEVKEWADDYDGKISLYTSGASSGLSANLKNAGAAPAAGTRS